VGRAVEVMGLALGFEKHFVVVVVVVWFEF